MASEIFRFGVALVGTMATLGVGAVVMEHPAIAQIRPTPPATSFATGRGIAQGAAFNRGRNANVALTLEGENWSLEMTEILPSNARNQRPGRVQYRGAIVRRTDEPGAANSFSLTTRVRSFDSSDNLRIITNTTGTCRIEVFNSRVISSTCNAVADNSSTDFLGLEQF